MTIYQVEARSFSFFFARSLFPRGASCRANTAHENDIGSNTNILQYSTTNHHIYVRVNSNRNAF